MTNCEITQEMIDRALDDLELNELFEEAPLKDIDPLDKNLPDAEPISASKAEHGRPRSGSNRDKRLTLPSLSELLESNGGKRKREDLVDESHGTGNRESLEQSLCSFNSESEQCCISSKKQKNHKVRSLASNFRFFFFVHEHSFFFQQLGTDDYTSYEDVDVDIRVLQPRVHEDFEAAMRRK